VETDADNEAAQTDQGFGKLTEANGVIALAESLLNHHLLAVMRPAFDEGGR
jgi:hypothetical protein